MVAVLFVLQSDLFQWSAVLDVIDAELAKKGEEYDRAIHLGLLRFTRSLLENCSNRHVYNSHEVRLDRSMPYPSLPPPPPFLFLGPAPASFPCCSGLSSFISMPSRTRRAREGTATPYLGSCLASFSL
jgi:hypothetical protein